MRALASFIMRGRMQAVLAAVLLSGLSLLLPPLLYLSGGTLALVGLRKGVAQGAEVMLLAGLALSALTWLAVGSPLPGLVFMGLVWLPVLFLAAVLRQTISLGFTLGLACTLGLLAVLAGFLILGDPTVWWQEHFEQLLRPTLEQFEMAPEEMESFIVRVAMLMTGIFAVAIVLNALFGLLVGRWWQSMLYNPGGFREEFHGLRLPKPLAWLTVLVLLAALAAEGGIGQLAGNLVIVLLFFNLLQGLAVAHAIVAGRGWNVGWLVVLYLLLLFVPQVMVLLILLGLSDSWLDFRKRFLHPPLDSRSGSDN